MILTDREIQLALEILERMRSFTHRLRFNRHASRSRVDLSARSIIESAHLSHPLGQVAASRGDYRRRVSQAGDPKNFRIAPEPGPLALGVLARFELSGSDL